MDYNHKKIAFASRSEIEGKSVKTNLYVLSICASLTALLKLNLWCSFPILVSTKSPRIDVLRIFNLGIETITQGKGEDICKIISTSSTHYRQPSSADR